MLSYHRSGVLHFGQCEPGETSDSSRGKRQTTTFKKLPTHAPRAKRKRMKVRCESISGLTPSPWIQGEGRREGIIQSHHLRHVHHRLFHGKICHVQLGG